MTEPGPCQAGRSVLMAWEDGTWPTAGSPCGEPAGRKIIIHTPHPGRYEFHARLCALHEVEFLSHFNVRRGERPPWEQEMWHD